MTFKSPMWYPIAGVLSAINLVAAGFAIGQAEPVHAAVHVALALAFGLWAHRLKQGSGGGSEVEARLDAVEAELGELGGLRQELGEVQERLDFAERLLAQAPETRRMGPQG
jgi:hypothetical protein